MGKNLVHELNLYCRAGGGKESTFFSPSWENKELADSDHSRLAPLAYREDA